MFAFHKKTKRKNEIAAFAVMTIMLLAVLVKSVLPVGFMPTVNKDGFTEIVICSGMGEKTISVPSGENPEPSHQEKPADKVCAFQLLASGKILAPSPIGVLSAPDFGPVSRAISNDSFALSFYQRSFEARGPPSA